MGRCRGRILSGTYLPCANQAGSGNALSQTSFLDFVENTQSLKMMQMLNWDWIRNKPRELTEPSDQYTTGWYSNAATVLRPPFLDPSVPPHELARWIDENTVTIHHMLLPHLKDIQENKATGFLFSLPPENPYWKDLMHLALHEKGAT